MILIIVESPTKAKKLREILGAAYRLTASMGHVRDLPPKGGLAVAFGPGDAVRPDYQPTERGAATLAELRRLAANAEQVLLATDPDREGEAIAWHLAESLGRPCRRVSFNAVTKAAVQAAINAPRDIDQDLVGAQQARRVLDRLVGWWVSPALRRGLGREARSAGRVQSAALRILVEREREIAAFTATDFFTLEARLADHETPPPFSARLEEWKGEPLGHRLAEAATAQAAADWCRRQPWQVQACERREQQRRPPPPFITSTVQQAASVRLRLAPDACMKLLQRLFEEGHITYHRTDSPALSPEAETLARTEIARRFPPEYLPAEPPRHAARAAANSQEAHEAIRPTHPEGGPEAVGSDQAGQLYRLIWERFIASQMSAGRDAVATLRVAVAPEAFVHPERGALPMGVFVAHGRQVRFDGWRRLTGEAAEDEPKRKRRKAGEGPEEEEPEPVAELPDLAVGALLACQDLKPIARRTKAPPRFTQASLIKRLEAAGIGRPSTYAAILGTLLHRGYVVEVKRLLQATPLGQRIVAWLIPRFAGGFIDLAYTARLEGDLDRIAAGQAEWQATTAAAARELWRALARIGSPPQL